MGRVEVVLAVDGNSLVHRAYHAAANSASSLSPYEEPVWAVRGLITQIVAAVDRVGADAVVVGFNVRPSSQAARLAEKEGVEIKTYSIIYNAIEEVKSAMEGLLEPKVV